MLIGEMKQEAKRTLAGNWGKGVFLTLAYLVATMVISFICNLIPVIGPIASLVISPVLAFGYLIGFIKLKRGEFVGYFDFLQNGFNQFGKVWGVIGHTILKMIIPVIVLVVAIMVFAFGTVGSVVNGEGLLGTVGLIAYIAALIWVIVKGFSYVLAQYILYDNPNMDSKAIVEKSEELMKGHKWTYFWLPITFLGWLILSVFTLYIGLLWLIPYMQVTLVVFYDSLANTSSGKSEVIDENNPIR